MRSHILPVVFANASTGKAKQWQIRVDELPEGHAKVTTMWGLVGAKIQTKVDIIKEGKNLGRTNETTPYDQAVLEANSAYQAKLDKNYVPEGNESPQEVASSRILLPMLAHDYRKRSHDIIWPAYAQVKLNGVRALAEKVGEGEINITSRKGKPFPEGVADHIIEDLNKIMRRGEVFDGEFYRHDWSFQDILRTVKKKRDWATQLEYHIFDIADPGTPFLQRSTILGERWKINDKIFSLRRVPTYKLEEAEQLKPLHDEFVREGYEGIIVRNAAGLYVFDHRVKDLQKYKEFIDEEFKIVGGYPETITDPETHEEMHAVVFECLSTHVPEEADIKFKIFGVRPRGTVASRVKMYNELDRLIGKELTVRYQELSAVTDERPGGLPIFPVGIAIRDYE